MLHFRPRSLRSRHSTLDDGDDDDEEIRRARYRSHIIQLRNGRLFRGGVGDGDAAELRSDRRSFDFAEFLLHCFPPSAQKLI